MDDLDDQDDGKDKLATMKQLERHKTIAVCIGPPRQGKPSVREIGVASLAQGVPACTKHLEIGAVAGVATPKAP